MAEIRDAYDAGQMVVLCSIAEGFPYTLIEAMTSGRPCVATDVGGVSEAVGDTGMIVPPRSPEALAQACLTLLQDASLRRRLGAAARMRALEYFTVDRAISAFDEIYTFVGTGLKLPTVEADDESDDLAPAMVPDLRGDRPARGGRMSNGRTRRPRCRRAVPGGGRRRRAAHGRPTAIRTRRARSRRSASSSPRCASRRSTRWRSPARWSSRAGRPGGEGALRLPRRVRAGPGHVLPGAARPGRAGGTPGPVGRAAGYRPALHSLLYALPGICFPAAIGLLIGPGVEIALIVALVVAWSMGQGLAYLGYVRLGRTMDMGQTRRVLRVGLVAGLAVVALAMVVTARLVHTPTVGAAVRRGRGRVHARRRRVLMVLGAELWLHARARARRAGQRRVPGPGPPAAPAARRLGGAGRHPAARAGDRRGLHPRHRPARGRAVPGRRVARRPARRSGSGWSPRAC